MAKKVSREEQERIAIERFAADDKGIREIKKGAKNVSRT
jgi:hypothetical protein